MQTPVADAADFLQRTMRDAMREHAAGHADAAEALYRQVLDRDPRQPDALHLLGVLDAQRGNHARAAELIAAAIAAHPREAMFHNNLGNVCVERGLFDDAEAHYVHAVELDPGRVDALNNLGVLSSLRGRAEGAEKLLLRVVELAPDFADARQNLANHYLRNRRLADAVQACFDGLIVAPRDGALRRILGVAYTTMGMTEQAIGVYRAWLDADPGNPVAEHHLRACTGVAVPERAADAYVARVFDAFAGSFDAKLAELDYKAPALVAEAVARHAGPAAKALDVLDAGCGTGLCGPLLAPWARHLAGVDLSEGMLRKAVARRVYDELVCGELVALLRLRPGACDLIVSADTLCYFGALDDCIAAAAAALRPGGLFVFTVESHPDSDGQQGQPPYRLQHHGRYSHRGSYLRQALAAAGLAVSALEPVRLRTEAGKPVPGWLVAARR